jgi:hypothetical protein
MKKSPCKECLSTDDRLICSKNCYDLIAYNLELNGKTPTEIALYLKKISSKLQRYPARELPEDAPSEIDPVLGIYG